MADQATYLTAEGKKKLEDELEELKKFVADPPEAHGFAANMKRCAEIRIAKTIISILEKSSESI